jgi:GNAT superfamily N-acetyltransferase
MQIVDFTAAYVEQATQIAKQNYETERRFVHKLPHVEIIPDLTPFAGNGLGAALVDGEELIGLLWSVPPFKNAFGSTGVTGVFSPMGANGAVGNNRAYVYARLYQAVGAKWVRIGAASHAVCLYAHDKEVQEQFFRYGFGLRCVDAIRGMDKIDVPLCENYTFSELALKEHFNIFPFIELFNRHFLASPTFMIRPDWTKEKFLESVKDDRFFVARKDGNIIAFISVSKAGETFIRSIPGYIHADGAFCLPEYRGTGVLQGLLNRAATTLKAEGYKYLGVDFESINPSAYAFWLKHFTAYTHSVVRRIDEGAVKSFECI